MGQSYVQMLDESYGHLDREFSTHKPHLQEISRVPHAAQRSVPRV